MLSWLAEAVVTKCRRPGGFMEAGGRCQDSVNVWAGLTPSEGPEGRVRLGLSPRLADGRLVPVALHVVFLVYVSLCPDFLSIGTPVTSG